MKTLHQALRTILLALALIGTSTTAFAYNFMVDGIYYNINGDEATVTYQRSYQEYAGNYIYHTYYDNDYSGSVIIPESVTYNGITYTVTAIGDHAFYKRYENSVIASVTLPSTITSIGEEAFYNCSSLRSITCQSTIPPTVNGNQSFYGVNYSNTTLYVPLDLVTVYATTNCWSSFSNIIGFGQNTFSIADYTTWYGDTIVIPVSMENVDEITAFQTDIYLPNGFELLKDGDEYLVELSSRKGRDHVIMASDAPDGAVRVLSYSPTLKTFSGNDGELFYFTVKVPNDGDGMVTYPIWLRKTLLTTIDEEEVGALEALSNVDVYFYILGDVDHSGIITVADVVLTAKYILNQNPEPFILVAADINGDGKITITDVVKIAHMVLDADYGEPTLRMTTPDSGDNLIGGEFDKNTHTVAISLNNDKEYTAFQFDVNLPEGIDASEFALTERASELTLNVKDSGNGKIRVMGYSPNVKSIKGSGGALLTFVATGDDDIMIDDIELVTPAGEIVHPNAFTITRSPVTAVKELAESKVVDHVDYYNMAGQRIDCPNSGATLVVTTYIDGTRSTTKIIK